MPSTPLIGVTTSHAEASWNAWYRPVSLVPSAYVEPVGAAGGRPVLLPHLFGGPAEAGAAVVVAVLDGLVLMGGNDVGPEEYGQEPHERAGGFDSVRDRWERALLAEALERDLPVLAICRGHQVLNVHLGGTLHQHLPEVVGHDGHRPAPGCFAEVDVVTVARTLTAEIFGEREGAVLAPPGDRPAGPRSRGERLLDRWPPRRGDRGGGDARPALCGGGPMAPRGVRGPPPVPGPGPGQGGPRGGLRSRPMAEGRGRRVWKPVAAAAGVLATMASIWWFALKPRRKPKD